MSLKSRFQFIFLAISIIPVIILTIFMYYRYSMLINEQMTNVVNNVNENAISYTNDMLMEIDNMTESFVLLTEGQSSTLDDIKKFSSKEKDYTTYDLWKTRNDMKSICQQLIYSNDYVNGIFIFLPNGENIGYGYGNGIDIKVDYTPFNDNWYQNTLEDQGGIYISNISEKEFILHSKPSISFSRALYDVYTREFLGVLFIDCSPKVFDLSSSNSLPNTALLSVTNAENMLLYSNIDDISYEFTKQNSKDVKVFKETNENYNVTVVCAINLSKLSEQFTFTKMYLIIFALICAFIVLIISLILSRYLTSPITGLSLFMRNHKNHKLITENKYLNRNDEIGILYNEYNNMIDEINLRIKNEYHNRLITLDSQMKSLEAQINSHFLFNTLESINSIAEIEEVPRISTMSLALGNMFRYSIKTESELVSISDEINHINDYLSIQRIRYPDRFEANYDIPEQLQSKKVLKLILQPLVENALTHGFNRCSITGTIKISAYIKSNNIIIEVKDNGIGMSSISLKGIQAILAKPIEFTEMGRRDKQSIGIKNIHSRIQLYYGIGYGLSIESKENNGTTITLQIPMIEKDDYNV